MQQYILKALNLNANIFFLGTDSEIEAAEKIEESRIQEIEKIIFSNSFYVIEYYTEYKQRRILHKSTRPGITYQLSYIDPDGVPAMHENFIEVSKDHDNSHIGEKRELLRHYLNASYHNDLILNVYSKEDLCA